MISLSATLDYYNESLSNPPSDKIMETLFFKPLNILNAFRTTGSEVSHFEKLEDSSSLTQSNINNIMIGKLYSKRDELFDNFTPDKPIKTYSVAVKYKFVGKGKPHFNKEQYIDS